MQAEIAGRRILPDYSELRATAEERPWRTDSPSPDHIGGALAEVGVPTGRHDYVLVTARDDTYRVRFVGDEDVEVPVERSSIGGAVRGVLSREYEPGAVRPGERPFVPSREVPEPYRRAVRLLDGDIREVAEGYADRVAEHRGGLQRTYLVD